MSFFGNLSALFGPTTEGNQQRSAAKRPTQPVVQGSKAQSATPARKPGKHVHGSKAQPPRPNSHAKATFGQPVSPRPTNHLQSQPAPTPVPSVDVNNLLREAQAKAREIIVEAKDEALAIRSKAEKEARDASRELEEQQRNLAIKLDRLDDRLTQIDRKEAEVAKLQQEIQAKKAQVEATQEQAIEKLEKVAGLTRDAAKQLLLDNLQGKLSKEMAQFIRQKEEEAEAEAESKVREILVDSMKHGATEYVPEYTVSTVILPSEEAKGKIIGKAGRNIHTFERVTGVDVDLDTSPTEVRLSSFDPVRREIARVSLERLIKDGRIQPTRIEEVVAKVTQELEKIMFEAGRKLCQDVGVYNLPPDLMRMLGKFKYRFSYGQNLIAHTLEETRIGIKLASELGADVNVVKLGCLLHDIGKVSDESEGSHVELGVKIAKKYGMPQSVIDCIAQHHEDEPFSGVEQVLVYIADAISGARPGARYENYEEYVERLQKLEEIATKYPEVRQAYAIQAGREVRVLLDPEVSKDDDVKVLSLKIKDEIKENMTYPGTVTVTVLRETRAQQVAT